MSQFTHTEEEVEFHMMRNDGLLRMEHTGLMGHPEKDDVSVTKCSRKGWYGCSDVWRLEKGGRE